MIKQIKDYFNNVDLSKIGFWILFILSLWAVLSWGFGWIPLIEVNINSNVASGTLALSYSYLAGSIFYFLTFSLPMLRKRKGNMKYLSQDIRDLGTEIHNTIEIFQNHSFHRNVDFGDIEGCKELLTLRDWNTEMGFEFYVGQNTYLKWFHGQTRKITTMSIDMIAKYKEILSEKQIEYLNDINDTYMLQLLDFIEAPGSISKPASEMIANRYGELIKKFSALNQSLKKNYRYSSLVTKVENKNEQK